jgi:hypothetical protein
MISSKFIIVVARPGARGDFVAGWLGSLPGFVDTQWRVDPYTGRSVGLMNCFRQIDDQSFNGTVHNVLSWRNYKISPNASTTFAFSCHGWYIKKIFSNKNVNGIKLLYITGGDDSLIKWEFFAKTWLTQSRSEHSHEVGQFYSVDSIINSTSDNDRKTEILKYFNDMHHSTPMINLGNLDHIEIDYNTIVDNNGSYTLASKLGLEVPDCYHTLWKSNLALSHSQTVYYKFDHEWRRDQMP